MLREHSYQPVVHGQHHFRALLDAVSRPGRIVELTTATVTPPPRLNQASALVAFALLNADVRFHLVNMTGFEADYLSINTGSAAAAIEDAGFVFADGKERELALAVDRIHRGSPTCPDTAATVVLQAEALSSSPMVDALRLRVEGPGVGGHAAVYTRGVSIDLLLALQARNIELPLGIDAVITCDDQRAGEPRVLGLPRTTRVTWERC